MESILFVHYYLSCHISLVLFSSILMMWVSPEPGLFFSSSFKFSEWDLIRLPRRIRFRWNINSRSNWYSLFAAVRSVPNRQWARLANPHNLERVWGHLWIWHYEARVRLCWRNLAQLCVCSSRWSELLIRAYCRFGGYVITLVGATSTCCSLTIS